MDGRFVLGAGAVALISVPLCSAAVRVRRRLLPQWHGPAARLAEVILSITALELLGQALGTVGLFGAVAVVAGAVILGLAVVGVFATGGGDAALAAPCQRPSPRVSHRRWRPITVGVGVACIAVTIGQWVDRIALVAEVGMTSSDTTRYHLPLAARFARSGWTGHVHFIRPGFPEGFHFANSELLHGVGMLLFGGDVLSVVLNMGFIGVAFLAAFTLGQRWGEGWLGVIAASVVLASNVLGIHAGAAGNDLAVLAFVLSAAALLGQRDRGAARFAVAGLAVGLALGTKETAIVPAVAFVVGVPFLAARGRRLAMTTVFVGCVLLTGAYWLVRNLVATGNPVPGADLGLFPSAPFRTLDDFGYSVAHYITDGEIWREWFLPGLRIDFGPTWWLTLGLGATATFAALLRGSAFERLAGAVIALGVVTYLLTPTTALGEEGQPVLFASNVRYVTPVLALALVSTVGTVCRLTGVRWILLVALVATFAVSQLSGGTHAAWPRGHRSWGMLGALLTAGVLLGSAALVRSGRSWSRVTRSAMSRGMASVAAVGLTAALVAASARFAHRYEEARYRDDALAQWANEVEDARIAIAGFGEQYQLYGDHLTNFVQYVGQRGPHGAFDGHPSCTAWRSALRQGRYDYVVVTRNAFEPERHELEWTSTDPAASLVLQVGEWHVLRFDRSVPDPGC